MSHPRREIVEAGAGCGKTRGLVYRYIEGLGYDPETGLPLPQGGFLPREITALTFTEDAAREMRTRVLKRLEELNLLSLRESVLAESRISTFHSLCLRLLKPQLESLGYSAHAEVLPGPVAREARIRHALAELAKDEDRKFLLEHLPLGSLADLAADLWFSPAVSSEDIHRSLRASAQAARDFINQHLPSVQNAILAEKDLKGDSWIETFRDSLVHPSFETADKITLSRGPRKLATQYPELLEATKAWRAFLDKGLHGSITELSLETESKIHETLNRFFAKLHRTGPKLLDYSALESELHKVLTSLSPDAPRLMAAPKLLLVDEFQDTNRIQYQILQALSAPETQWYFVGDPKQSIYRFRGAEVSLFRELKDELSLLELSSNYRSDAPLLDFMNQVQRGLFRPERELDPPAQFLNHGPQKRLSSQLLEDLPAGTSSLVRILEKPRTESFIADLAQDYRARAQELGPESTHAALFTSWKKLYAAAAELESTGVPIRISGTEPHLDHHLTALFSAFLEWMEDPSQMKGAFALLAWEHDRASDQSLALPTAEQIVELSERLGSLSAGESWSMLLNRFVAFMRPSRWKRGAEWTAAMERLILNLEGLQLSLQFSLGELARFLERNAPHLEIDIPGLVLPDASPQVLQLYTVHGSKGLEFDAVYLPEFVERNRRARGVSIDASADGSTAFRFQILDPKTQEKHPSLRFALQENLYDRETEAESRRLFYVALTRAKKTLNLYLHTPADSKKTPEAVSIFGWPSGTPQLWNKILIDLRDDGTLSDLEERSLLIWKKSELAEESPPEEVETERDLWLFPEAPAALPESSLFFREGVSRYIERRLPSPARNFIRTDKTSGTQPGPQSTASELGEAVHGVLELWNGDVTELENLLPQDPERESIRLACLSVRQLPELKDLWAALAQKDPGVRREFGLYIYSNEYRLSGYADLIWERGSEILILDWKTSARLSSLNREDRLAKIRLQLQLYARAFGGRYTKAMGLAVGIELGTKPRASVLFHEAL